MSPYVDGVLTLLLRDALPDLAVTGDSRVYTRIPADLADRLPCLVARQVPGGALSLGPLGDTGVGHQVQVDAYAATARDAQALAGRALAALVRAGVARTHTADGWLTRTALAQPWDAADAGAPDGVARWQVTGVVSARKT